jgi:hypothetical protein
MSIFTGFIVSVIAQLLSELVSVAKNKNRRCHPCESRGPERKTGFPLEFIPHTMRGGNDKYCFRNRNELVY